MIVFLLGGAGSGKTFIAKKMEKYIKDSFVIDGDELRAETKNDSLTTSGRGANIHLGYSRARKLSDLGFTVFVAMQAPLKEIRDLYKQEHDMEVLIQNLGDNPKDDKGYNKDFNPDYTCIDMTYTLQTFSEEDFYSKVFKKVLVPARFQGFHKGHKVVLEIAKRISPNITIGLRVDNEDIIDLDKNINLLESRGYNVIKTPEIDEDWTSFANLFDIYVQGNPMVIERFSESKCKLEFVPRFGDVSGTDIRKSISEDKDVEHQIDDDVKELIKSSI